MKMLDDKILDDELMTEDELDKVAGGTVDEIIGDFKFFERECGIICSEESLYDGQPAKIVKLELIKAAFDKFGVKAELFADDTLNKYSINGEQVSQEDAWNHVMKQMY